MRVCGHDGYVVSDSKNLKISTPKTTVTHISRHRKKKKIKTPSVLIPPASLSLNLKIVDEGRTLRIKSIARCQCQVDQEGNVSMVRCPTEKMHKELT